MKLSDLQSLTKLPDGGPDMTAIPLGAFTVSLSASLMCAFVASLLYLAFYANRASGSQIHRAFPLLALSITAIFVCVQFSLPLSLGLLGALSIVRFRTPIKEPEEVGFLMVVIAASIGCATFNFLFVALLMGFSVVALVTTRLAPFLLGDRVRDGMLLISLPGNEYVRSERPLADLFGKVLKRGVLESVASKGERTSVTYSFKGLRGKKLSELREMLQEHVPDATIEIFVSGART